MALDLYEGLPGGLRDKLVRFGLEQQDVTGWAKLFENEGDLLSVTTDLHLGEDETTLEETVQMLQRVSDMAGKSLRDKKRSLAATTFIEKQAEGIEIKRRQIESIDSKISRNIIQKPSLPPLPSAWLGSRQH